MNASFQNDNSVDESVLHLAARLPHLEIVEELIARGAKLDALDGEDRTPLTVAINTANLKLAAFLIEKGSDVNFKSKKDERGLLLLAASNLNTFELLSLLIEKGADIKEVDKKTGNTILHFLAAHPEDSISVETLKALIAVNADLNVQNNFDRTALHIAVNSRKGTTNERYDFEALFLKNGASSALKDKRSRVALHLAFTKFGKHNDASQMDPIELVALLDPNEGKQ